MIPAHYNINSVKTAKKEEQSLGNFGITFLKRSYPQENVFKKCEYLAVSSY